MDAPVAVIGRFPAYEDLAQATGANYFHIPSKIYDSMTAAEQWAANTKFLDRQIANGARFRLASPISEAKVGTAFRKEVDYLEKKGYELSKDGKYLVKQTSQIACDFLHISACPRH